MWEHMLQEGRVYGGVRAKWEAQDRSFSKAMSHSIHLMGKRDEEQEDSDLSLVPNRQTQYGSRAYKAYFFFFFF